ncbi:MAG: hypothetical protein KBI18_08190 [Brachymonas sp.]|nr:hypothetical protein [Brachymonas sp.]MBP8597590.1 hypothetical protein [Brachymonas sp.]
MGDLSPTRLLEAGQQITHLCILPPASRMGAGCRVFMLFAAFCCFWGVFPTALMHSLRSLNYNHSFIGIDQVVCAYSFINQLESSTQNVASKYTPKIKHNFAGIGWLIYVQRYRAGRRCHLRRQ